MSLRRVASLALTAILLVTAGVAQSDAESVKLLDHLAGRWVMKGRIGKNQVIHDVDAEWVLNREYLRFHELSRKTSAGPAYEALVFIEWSAKKQEYVCMWLDSTSGGGLSAEGLAHAKKSGDAMPFLFVISPKESLHTTFHYDAAKDAWRLTIDDVDGDRTDHFADVELTRLTSK